MPTPLTPAKLESIFFGYDLTFQEALQNQPTIWQQIASEKTSTKELEIYGWLDLIPQLREWFGPRVVNQLSTRVQQLKNKKFELTVGVEKTKIEDDSAGLYTDYVRMMGVSSKLWPEDQVIAAVKAAASAVVYDNQNFFDTDHPQNMDIASSPTQSNDFDYSSAGVDGSTPGLTLDNLADARSKMMSLMGANGEPLAVEPNILLVPPQLETKAKELLNSAIVAQAVGTIGVAPVDNPLKGLMTVVKSARLSGDASHVYMLDCRMPVKPFIFQQRAAPEFTPRFDPADPHVFDLDEYIAGVRARGAAGYGPWWLAARVKVS